MKAERDGGVRSDTGVGTDGDEGVRTDGGTGDAAVPGTVPPSGKRLESPHTPPPKANLDPTESTLPEYGANPFLRGSYESPFGWRRLREEYGWVRGYFKSRPRRYRELQQLLNQAQMGYTYDEYLTRITVRSGMAALVGVFVGVMVTVVLNQTGILPTLRSPVGFPGDLGRFVVANRVLFAGLAVTTIVAATLGVLTWVSYYYYPRIVVDNRRRNVEIVLPHAIIFMYALSQGGTSLVEVIAKLSEADDVYGEVAREFETIERDIELFGSDLSTALQNARNLTPSESLEQFLDDMLSVIDTGGDVTAFFETQSETYLDEAKEEQKSFLETLGVLSEFFIAVFVAAPLFLIVTLMVVSLIGGNTLGTLSILIYVILPLGMVGFVVFIDLLSAPYVQARTVARIERNTELEALESLIAEDPRLAAYANRKRRLAVRAFLADPLVTVRRNPVYSMLVTVPLAVVAVAVVVSAGLVTPTAGAVTEAPIQSTIWLAVLPLLIVAVPLSWFHERKRSREKTLVDRMPDTLNVVSSANKMGIQLTDALEIVARWSTSKAISTQMRYVRNDILWNHDTRGALIALADRIGVPQLSRTLKLIAEGHRSSSDLSTVLSVAAEDARERAKIERARRRELATYTGIVVIGFLVYLLVVVVLDTAYLTPITEVGRPTADAPGGFPTLGNIPVDTYRTMFFHSALIQGFGAGLLAGKLADNQVLSGLKYGILLVAISLVAFLII